MELKFSSEEDKTAFLQWLDAARALQTPVGAGRFYHRELLEALLEVAERSSPGCQHTPLPPTPSLEPISTAQATSMLEQAGVRHTCNVVLCMADTKSCGYILGMYTSGVTSEGQQLFICEVKAFEDLCTALVQPCLCHSSTVAWRLTSLRHVRDC